MNALKIGIVSETLVQQRYLKHAVEESGCSTAYTSLVSELVKTAPHSDASLGVDAWVVVADMDRLDERQDETAFQQWLYELNEPVILSEGNTSNAAGADFISWARQLKTKLLALEGQMALAKRKSSKARYVWVLAASTGGPEAVKRFLDAMESDIGVGFIYAQHIDQHQCRVLSEKISRDSHYESFVASHGDIVAENTIVIMPSDSMVELQPNGSLISHKNRPWRGIYQPSIDQIIANVASVYGEYSGVIFFTGMGDDGAMGCRLMSLRKGQVWAQSIASCVAPAMPQEAIDTGYVNKVDTPESLAIHLKTILKAQAKGRDKVVER